jgi:hypothetical protein
MGRGSNRGLGIDFTFPFQEGFINNRGETLIHEVGLRCVCNQEDMFSGQIEHGDQVPRRRRKFGCERCDGIGYLYRQPRRVIALLTGVRQSKTQLESGWAMPGDALVSVKPGVQVSGGDRFTFTWSEPVPDGQVVMRGAASLNDNQNVDTNLEDNEDRLWYNAESSIYCEDEDGNVYSSDGDFTLDGSKVIKWHGNSPAKKKVYTLKYNAYLEWIVFLPPDLRRDRDRDLGIKMGIRKSHVAFANANPQASAEDRITFCNRLSKCA